MRREDRFKYSSRHPKAHAPIYERRNAFDGNKLEKAFTEEWAKKCSGSEHGILDAILAPPEGRGRFWHKRGIRLTTTDCVIVASVIQWLGTNIGFAFLQTVLAKDGWEIRARPDRRQHSFDWSQTTTKINPALTSVVIAKTLIAHFEHGKSQRLSWGEFEILKVVDYFSIFRCERFVLNDETDHKMTIYQCALEIRKRVKASNENPKADSRQ